MTKEPTSKSVNYKMKDAEFSKNSWSEKQGFGMIFAAGILKVV